MNDNDNKDANNNSNTSSVVFQKRLKNNNGLVLVEGKGNEKGNEISKIHQYQQQHYENQYSHHLHHLHHLHYLHHMDSQSLEKLKSFSPKIFRAIEVEIYSGKMRSVRRTGDKIEILTLNSELEKTALRVKAEFLTALRRLKVGSKVEP
eukprot:Awhi_evm1s7926